ncbi:MAG: response regulator [Nitrospirales bacterium]
MEPTIPILLVEDNRIDIEVVRRALQKANIPNPLYTVLDGVEALEILTGNNGREKIPQPCLILLDINMPRMNGFELLEAMCRDDTIRHNVVFMLTTSARNEDKLTAYSLNAAGYILKENLRPFITLLGEYCRINEWPTIRDRKASLLP